MSTLDGRLQLRMHIELDESSRLLVECYAPHCWRILAHLRGSARWYGWQYLSSENQPCCQ